MADSEAKLDVLDMGNDENCGECDDKAPVSAAAVGIDVLFGVEENLPDLPRNASSNIGESCGECEEEAPVPGTDVFLGVEENLLALLRSPPSNIGESHGKCEEEALVSAAVYVFPGVEENLPVLPRYTSSNIDESCGKCEEEAQVLASVDVFPGVEESLPDLPRDTPSNIGESCGKCEAEATVSTVVDVFPGVEESLTDLPRDKPSNIGESCGKCEEEVPVSAAVPGTDVFLGVEGCLPDLPRNKPSNIGESCGKCEKEAPVSADVDVFLGVEENLLVLLRNTASNIDESCGKCEEEAPVSAVVDVFPGVEESLPDLPRDTPSDIGESCGKCEEEAPVSTAVPGTNAFLRVEGSLPDLLKNTPSNIARLEDEIEQCKGRQKYLAHTNSDSDGGDVRWYFCKVPLAVNELAASVPRSEIVGKSDYFRFGMRDSLAIEASFLQREEELLSAWWKEYAECSEGPRERRSSSKKLDIKPNLSSSDSAESAKLYDCEEERVGVPVKGGLYEVDLVKRHCFPVYWNGENRRVLRGHWFARKGGLDWLPIREDVAEQLEIAYRKQVWHRRTFQPSGLFAARINLQGSTPGLHALFTGEDDTWEAWLNIDASGFSSVLNFSGHGIKLRRGYSPSDSPKPTQDELRQQKEEEMDDYCSQVPVRHLVFMVHGIGQRLEKSNLVDDVGNFHHITASLAERHLTSHQRGTQRVLYIPCQWRRGLKLSGETAVEKITLDGVRGLRVTLSATVHDVLYYMSPIYCQDIIDSVSKQLNRLYLKFLKRNPGYEGKVSIYGHSLGSVLSYDILCHQEVMSSPFPMDWMYKEDARNDESPSDVNQSNMCTSTTNMEDRNSIIIDETENTADPADKNKTSAQPAPAEYDNVYADDLPATACPTELDSDERSLGAVDPEQLNNQEDIHELVCNSSNMLSQENSFDEVTEINCVVPGGTFEAEEVCGEANNEEKIVELLKEEINSLKGKIAELELQCNVRDTSGGWHQGNEKMLVNTSQQSKSEMLSPNPDGGPKSYTPCINYTKLEFKVDTFFAVGSPLGVFLALRNIRIGIGKGQEYWEENIKEEMPACRQMFNIFHPYDPVAYRIEPLVCKDYISERPVIIPYHRGGRRLHIGLQEFAEDMAVRSQTVLDHLKSVRVQVLTVCQPGNTDSSEEGSESVQQKEEISYGCLMMERVTGGDGRIDHVLQDKTFEHPYLQAIGAHTNYWRDYDTALFMLKHLYRDIPEDPESPREGNEDNSLSRGWSDQREITEEDVPLTFSDMIMVKNFSRKAKKYMMKS